MGGNGPGLGHRERRPELTRSVDRVLAVVAHPDDESFGLGALLDRFTSCGIAASVLCFTHGEASTLGSRGGDLQTIRATELRVAARVLGVERVELLDYPDGRLEQTPISELAAHVTRLIRELEPSHLLAFDDGGVTGHPDHQQATGAALAAAVYAAIPVFGWAIPQPIAERLNAQYGTGFRGRRDDEMSARLSVSRTTQRRALMAHASQSSHNPVLQHRLRLLGDNEHLRLLSTPD